MIGFALIAVASLASSSLVAAQQDGVGIGNQTIIPTSVDVNTRNGWCRSEKDTCTTLCSKNWSTNDCDQNTLEVSCVCADGSKPELVNYRNTLPFFICQEYIAQCVAGMSFFSTVLFLSTFFLSFLAGLFLDLLNPKNWLRGCLLIGNWA
ncbi:hypothetical protein TWF569_003453 [Orbilia oligospora]|uniref:DUF7707 domain-containing protein n=1 Tax=Orbilia oligospora TaxID=2813651 RepID=A0A7C8NDX9_ORBOL|nr:hypothetical protein TWF706_003659 [Orbilia oligospora]KAF3105953.1 hypothetical protein TWF102_001854 [Orbilia oligospora]KAF3112620.1 hypothetical protein TWF103_002861 [Orbilia oligospora]KAF3136834.1 hypothetical protein TWF594_007723 [Orbilia oligospora]KAF3151736.1 hypothetical protein TWF569_003453 [Orbilia oligospora]